MSKTHRGAMAELVHIVGNLIYLTLLFALMMVLLPVIIGIKIYERRKNED